jgi:hypothetical protein
MVCQASLMACQASLMVCQASLLFRKTDFIRYRREQIQVRIVSELKGILTVLYGKN